MCLATNSGYGCGQFRLLPSVPAQRAVSPEHPTLHNLWRHRAEKAAVITRGGVVSSQHHPAVREDFSHTFHDEQVGPIRPSCEDDITDTRAASAANEHAVSGPQMRLHRGARNNGTHERPLHDASRPTE